jgi:hypothetical protein
MVVMEEQTVWRREGVLKDADCWEVNEDNRLTERKMQCCGGCLLFIFVFVLMMDTSSSLKFIFPLFPI